MTLPPRPKRHSICDIQQGRRNVNVFGLAELKIEDSRSLEMAISEFYQDLFERSVSLLIELCAQFSNAEVAKMDLRT